VPSRESLSVSNRPAVGTMQRGSESQRYFSKMQPGPAPQSFDRQAAQVQQEIQRNGQFRPINAAPSRGVANVAPGQNSGAAGVPRPSPGVRMGNGDVRPGANSAAQPTHGINPVGNQATGNQAAGNRSIENRSMGSDGWRRFGSGQNQSGVQNQT